MEFNCAELGIPERLHRQGRAVVPEFADDEVLYHRVSPEIELPSEKVPPSVFQTTPLPGKSFNRSRLCKAPEDVLYPTKKGEDLTKHGIVEVSVKEVREISFVLAGDKPRVFSLSVEHVPILCNYSHSQLQVLEAETVLQEISSKQAKSALRTKLALAARLVKQGGVTSPLSPE